MEIRKLSQVNYSLSKRSTWNFWVYNKVLKVKISYKYHHALQIVYMPAKLYYRTQFPDDSFYDRALSYRTFKAASRTQTGINLGLPVIALTFLRPCLSSKSFSNYWCLPSRSQYYNYLQTLYSYTCVVNRNWLRSFNAYKTT